MIFAVSCQQNEREMIEITPHPDDPRAYRLQAEIVLPLPRDEVFDFFGDAFNLERLTPSWMNFSVLTPPPIEMRAGTLIDYKLRLRGIPIRWRTKITGWEPPFRFRDEQLKGPYRFWRHEHTFTDVEGGCLARDQVDYAVPGGRLVHWLVVRRDVERIFQYRSEVLRRIFSTETTGASFQTSATE